VRFQVTKGRAGNYASLDVWCEGKRELPVKIFVWSIVWVFAGMRRMYWRIKPKFRQERNDSGEEVIVGRTFFRVINKFGPWGSNNEKFGGRE